MDRPSVYLLGVIIRLRRRPRCVWLMILRPVGDTLSQSIEDIAALIRRADDAFAGIDVASTVEADFTSQTLDIRTGVELPAFRRCELC